MQCCINDWPDHKIAFERAQKVRAANAMHNAVVIGSKHPSGKKNGTHRDGSGDEKSSQDGE